MLKITIVYCNILSKGLCRANDVIVSAPSENNKKPWTDIGAAVTRDNSKYIICK